MFTKKAAKQLRKLPASVRGAAVRAIETSLQVTPINKRRSTLGSVKLGMNYRMVVERNSPTIVWIGSHEDYNNYLKRI